MMKSHNRTRMICEGGLLVAAAQVLSMVKLWEMPWGGSVTLAMIPVIIFCVRWGLFPGLLIGLVLGVLQFMFDGGFAIGWQSIIGDYLLAFTVLGLAGVMHGKRGALFTGTLIGGIARYLVHFVVGATIWADYMPDTFLGLQMASPWFYSALYNIVYMGPNILITLVAFVFLAKPLARYLTAED